MAKSPDNVSSTNELRSDASLRARRRRLWWYLLLLVQFAAVVWPPLYNKVEPAWAGIPFFYWYQLLWIVIGAVLTAIVYFATESTRQDSNPGNPPPVA